MQTVGKMQPWQLAIIIYMKFGGEIRRIVQGGRVEMNLARIMVSLKCHGRAALVTEKASDPGG